MESPAQESWKIPPDACSTLVYLNREMLIALLWGEPQELSLLSTCNTGKELHISEVVTRDKITCLTRLAESLCIRWTRMKAKSIVSGSFHFWSLLWHKESKTKIFCGSCCFSCHLTPLHLLKWCEQISAMGLTARRCALCLDQKWVTMADKGV